MATDASSSGDGESAFSEFLADYFIECEEHLATARGSVLALEPQLESSVIDRGLVDELFRAFHSLKGLSAMVGFHEAEQLAHQLETFLAAVRKSEVRLQVTGLEVLIAGISALEQIIAARRDAIEVPDASSLISKVAALAPRSPSSGAGNKSQSRTAADPRIQETKLADKLLPGVEAWRVTFTPSAELVARGIDVNQVRARLQQLGDIVQSEPIIDAEGKISFAFVVTTKAEHFQETLQGEGLRCEPFSLAERPSAQIGTAPRSSVQDGDPSTHLTPANLVRVDLGRLDDLMRIVGELVLSRARLDDGLKRLDTARAGGAVRSLQETNSAIERQLRDLREGVMRVRMVPVREVFARMQFVVRDLVRELGKQATLRFSGEETQIDKYVVERIMDPLLHLVRNAVSHGLESAEERKARGKSPVGHIDLRAKTTGETVVIEIEDDGRGIDAEAILAQARTLGLVPEQSTAMTESVLDVLCIPGFSTQQSVDRASGRGVGMDVVRRAVEEMGGSLALETSLGRGSRFVIQVPLTLAITDALIVEVAGQQFAVPQVAVREVLHSESTQSVRLENNELLRYHGGVIPLFRLAALFGSEDNEISSFYALVVGEGAQAVGLVVDRLAGLREVVVRPLTDRLVKVPGIAGATELGDGKVVLILDALNLVRALRKQSSAPGLAASSAFALPTPVSSI